MASREGVNTENACGKCRKEVKDKDCGVQCELCDKWWHTKCEGIRKEAYEMMQEERGIKWFCSQCREKVGNVLEEMKKIKSKTTDLEEKMEKMGACVEKLRKESVAMKEIEEVRTELRSLRGDLATKKALEELRNGIEKMKKDVIVKKEVEEVKKTVMALKNNGPVKTDVVTEVKKTFAEIMASERQREESEGVIRAKEREMATKMKEVLEREKRKLNVVLMGVPEMETEEDELEGSRKVVDAIVTEVKIEYEIMGRIGKKGDKIRPLRIRMADMEDKRRVLYRAKNLKKVEGMQRIYVVSDLTKAQQEEEKKLRIELKRVRDEGDANAKISKGVIVPGIKANNSEGINVA